MAQQRRSSRRFTREPQRRRSPKPAHEEAHRQLPVAPVSDPSRTLCSAVGNARIARLLAGPERDGATLAEVGWSGGLVSNRLANRIYGSLGSGRPLSSAQQSRLESSFGTPLGHVRVHDDAEADELSLGVGASAFTLGSDIYFSRFSSPSDDSVLDHEVAHVIQQAAMPVSGPLTVGEANDPMEREAEAFATTQPLGRTTNPQLETPGSRVQRDWLETAYNYANNAAGAAGLGTSLIMEAARGTQAAGVSRAGDLLARGAGSGVQSLGNALGPVGLITGALGFGQGVDQMLNAPTFGERLTGGTDALFSGLGAFSGGVGTASLLGAGTASLGPAAAVAGAGAGGYALGRLLDEGVGAIGSAITGDEQGDYTISGGLASGMTALDQALTPLWAEEGEPEYTQTLGWKLGEWLGV